MKIVNVCTHFTDDITYQENVLTKYMVKNGHQVYVLASPMVLSKEGTFSMENAPFEHINRDGVVVIRLPFQNPVKLNRKLRKLLGFKETLNRIKPDVIFFHNLQSLDVLTAKEYVERHHGVKLFVDGHSDFSNSALTWFSREIYHKIFWRHIARIICPKVDKFYGVLPARVDFLVNVYKLPADKVELLVMGGDDEYVEYAQQSEVNLTLREKYGIGRNDFLIVTGGKIDFAKKQTLLLLQAVNELDHDDVKLIIFGPVENDIKEKMMPFIDNNRTFIAGWQDAKASYAYFGAADLVVFPGRHSVYWEQVVSQGIPLICKYWEGTTHVDIGGNVEFLYKDSVEEIKGCLNGLLANDREKYKIMQRCALKQERENFLYSNIADRCINS